MISEILKISLNNRFLVLFASILIIVTGIYLVDKMEVDVFPDLTSPTVTIITEAHGLDALEVERLVTYHLETAVNGSPGVRRIRSSSMLGISLVWIEFDWGIDIYKARQIVSERLPIASKKLPDGVSEPFLAPITSIMGEIMIMGLHSEELTPMELRTIADWDIVPQLKSVPGVAQVIAIGGEVKQYQVLVDPLKMDHYDVSIQDVARAVKNANQNQTGGILNQYGNQYDIKFQGRLRTLEDLANATLLRDGEPLRIRDVADVLIGGADKIGDASLNAEPAVILIVFKQPQINTLNLTEEVKSLLAELSQTLPEELGIDTGIFQQADFIQSSINNLQKTLVEGALFVSIILFLFLLNWRTTIISLVAIPLSLLSSFIVLYLLGYTINTMSLGGMAIAIGVLVDDAIIDVENVFKRLRENNHLPEAERKPSLTVVFEASLEIRSSIVIATFIIILSFTPLLFLSGIEGRLLQPLGIAFIVSLLTSLLVAITVTPVLSSYLLTGKRTLKVRREGSWVERRLRRLYRFTLPFFLRRAWLWIILVFLLFGFSLYIATSRLGRSFLPEFNEGSLVITAVARPGISLEESNRMGTQIQELLLELPEINKISRRTGRAETDEHAQGVHSSEFDAPFTLEGKSKELFFNEVRQELSAVAGMNISLGQPIAHRIDHMLSGTRANIAVKILGPDLGTLFRLGKEMRDEVKGIPGLVDLLLEQQIEVPQIRIIPNPVMLTKYGLTIGDLSEVVKMAIKGEAVSQVYEGQKFFDLIVRYQKDYRNEIEKLSHIFVETQMGERITISEVAEVHSLSSPNSIGRENVSRKVVLSANVSGRDIRSVVKDIQEINADLELPKGYRIEYGGQFESEERASQILLVAAIFAIVLILVLLFYEFKDMVLAGIVMINLPLALIGAILIVSFTSGIISIASTIGFISLLGITTRNGILLVSRYQTLSTEIGGLIRTIIKGSEDRLIPILMTAVTTALALIPVAIAGNESGNEIQAPMAIVIIGGLLSSTFLNLVIIPCVYYLIMSQRAHEKFTHSVT